MTNSKKTSAIAAAKNNVAGDMTQAFDPAMLAMFTQFMANGGQVTKLPSKEEAKASKAAEKQAATTGSKERRIYTDEEKAAYTQKKSELVADLKSKFLYHSAVVSGGKKHKGATVEVVHVSVSRWNEGLARIFIDGQYDFVGTKHLTAGEPLPAKRVAALEEERKAENEATVYVVGQVQRVADKSVLVRCADWFKPSYFPFAMITKTGAMVGDFDIFEVPSWKVKQDNGPAALEIAMQKQDALSKIVDAYDGSPISFGDSE